MSERKSRILIADENEPNVELLLACLRDVNCDVAVAVDGPDALAKVDSFQPDLILLNTVLPNLSGLEVCTWIKNHRATHRVLVLMFGTLNDLREIEQIVDAGADDFLSTPIVAAELRPRVDNLLRLRQCL